MNEYEKEINELTDSIGEFIEYWGFRNIHGRIWARVFISENPLSTPEIIQQLGVSKALVSGALSELVSHNLLVKVGQVKYGGFSYKACSNPAEVVRNIVKNRELALLEKIQFSISNINQLNKSELSSLNINKESVGALGRLTSYHKKIANKLIKKNINTLEEWISFIKNLSRFSI